MGLQLRQYPSGTPKLSWCACILVLGACTVEDPPAVQRVSRSAEASIQAGACQLIDSEARASSELERVEQPIYGGVDPEEGDPFISSTLALFSRVDLEYGFAEVDGSATLISPTVALGAAHTCTLFDPQFASLGLHTPREDEASFERQLRDAPQGELVRILSCVTHPDYTRDAHRPNDIALFYLSHTPLGARPAAIIDPSSPLPTAVTIVGYGARDGQFDAWWEGIEAYRLQRVDTWISATFQERGLFMDGPQLGHGSCQGDSGGPIYQRRQQVRATQAPEADTQADQGPGSSDEFASQGGPPLLLGAVVMGPECDEGIGYNSDLRQYVDWIASQEGVSLQILSPEEEKHDQGRVLTHCP
ncbi:MAG: trypsin-like serine protease [Myxococcota bacterium]|nr:trypsin-like serine protease [Myxococcota bacterium]